MKSKFWISMMLIFAVVFSCTECMVYSAAEDFTLGDFSLEEDCEKFGLTASQTEGVEKAASALWDLSVTPETQTLYAGDIPAKWSSRAVSFKMTANATQDVRVYLDRIWLSKSELQQSEPEEKYDESADGVFTVANFNSDEIIKDWNLTPDTENVLTNNVSARWDFSSPTDIVKNNISGTDISGYNYINLLVYSPEATGGALNIVVWTAEGERTYKYLQTNVDFEDWKVWTIKLFDFNSAYNATWATASKFQIASEGWDAVPDGKTVLNIERIWFSKDMPKPFVLEENVYKDIGLSDKIDITFSNRISAGKNVITMTDNSANTVPLNVKASGKKLIAEFKNLEAETEYTISFPQLRDFYGQIIEGAGSISFTTGKKELVKTDVNIVNSKGIPISEIPEAGTVKATVTVTNNFDSERTAYLYLAAYNADGSLKEIKCEEYVLSPGEEKYFSAEAETAAFAKAFVCDLTEGMQIVGKQFASAGGDGIVYEPAEGEFYYINSEMGAEILDKISNAKNVNEISGILAENRIADEHEKKHIAGCIMENKPYTSFDELEKVINSARGLLDIINSENWMNYDKIFAENNEILFASADYASYSKLKSTVRTEICNKIFLHKPFYDFAQLREAMQKELKAYEATSKKETSQSSGGGGGSSFAISTTVSSAKPEDKQEVKVRFSDIEDAAWAKTAVTKLVKCGIIADDDYFRPYDNVTRAEFVKMLVLAFAKVDAGAEASFADVSKDAWYYQYVATGEKLGIASGDDSGRFNAASLITRQDMAAMAYRISGVKSESVEKFADDAQISGYAREAVYAMKAKQIINGVGENRFMPKAYATRAQTAVIISNLVK